MSLEPAKRRREQSRADARRVILDATENLLVEGGYEHFSMRKLVDRCGYSAPTIYHYFGDKPGLLDALLQERLELLVGDLRRVSLGSDPVANMRATSRAFAHFGLKNPSHYFLLTVPRAPDTVPPPAAEEASAILAQPMSDLFDQGRLHFDNLDEARQVLWSFMHGLISLQLSRPDEDWSPDLVDHAIEAMIRGCLRSELNGQARSSAPSKSSDSSNSSDSSESNAAPARSNQ
jgi:AcrR family transcriptional regulator